MKYKLITILSSFTLCLTLQAAPQKPKVHLALVATNSDSNSKLYCRYQIPAPAKSCHKIAVSNTALFTVEQLESVSQLQNSGLTTITNAYNSQSMILPGQAYKDVTIRFAFKKDQLINIKQQFARLKDRQLAVIINDLVVLTSPVSDITDNNYDIKKKIDTVLANDIVENISLAIHMK